MRLNGQRLLNILLLSGLFALKACASGYSFQGTLSTDADVRFFNIALSAPGTVVIRTLSYAGGQTLTGANVARGGFDPSLSVFDANGNLVATNADGGCGTVPADAVTFLCWDASITQIFPAGKYLVALTESSNMANGPTLADSFAYSGQGDFTEVCGLGQSGGFLDYSCNQRNPSYALEVSGVGEATSSDLVITTTSLAEGMINFPTAQQLIASGGTPPLTWTLGAEGAPLGSGISLSLDGTLTAVPVAPGFYTIPVQVADSSSHIATRSLQWTVAARRKPMPPIRNPRPPHPAPASPSDAR